MYRLHFEEGEYLALHNYLLADAPRERAAFVYVEIDQQGLSYDLHVRRVELLTDGDFVVQAADYLEITDEARQRVIKTAHGGGLAVVEFHSHPFDFPAELSNADYLGLQKTVPHMLWRLKGRPYAAVVVGPNDFDGLVWPPGQPASQILTIIDGESEFAATGRSLRKWKSS
jgi:proteasome lid subunit RPN8/RPN11